MDTSPVDEIRALQDSTVALLQRYQRRNELDLHPYQRVEILREIAENQVRMREHFFTDTGAPDWAGRTWAYRNAVGEIYARAGIRGAEKSTLSATVRYHVGNMLRDRLSDEELAEIGLRKVSPRQRSVEKREKVREFTKALTPGTPSEPNRDLIRALVTTHTLLAHTEPEPREGTDLVEALHWLDVVEEDVQRLRSTVSGRRRRG